MSFTAENNSELDVQTQSTDVLPASEHANQLSQVLIVFQEKSSVVKVFHPRSKHITFGRSSSCIIKMSDPRFSRVAGEIVLGPVPLLKEYRNGQKQNEYTSMHPGNAYRIRPYKIILMEPGDIVINQGNTSSKRKNSLLVLILVLFSLLGMSSMISKVKSDKKTLPANENSDSIASTASPDEYYGNKNEQGDKIDNEESNVMLSGLAKAASTNQVSTTIFIPVRSEKVQPSKGRPENVEQGESRHKAREIYIAEDELERVIKTAVSMIEQGSVVTAGRILKPLILHTSKDQREKIIEKIDPLINALFQKAYMLRIYKPDRSKEILENITESGLELLPSFLKAKNVLENTQELRNLLHDNSEPDPDQTLH